MHLLMSMTHLKRKEDRGEATVFPTRIELFPYLNGKIKTVTVPFANTFNSL